MINSTVVDLIMPVVTAPVDIIRKKEKTFTKKINCNLQSKYQMKTRFLSQCVTGIRTCEHTGVYLGKLYKGAFKCNYTSVNLSRIVANY